MMAEGLALSGFAIPATLTLIAAWQPLNRSETRLPAWSGLQKLNHIITKVIEIS
jgi:hypothetical protein